MTSLQKQSAAPAIRRALPLLYAIFITRAWPGISGASAFEQTGLFVLLFLVSGLYFRSPASRPHLRFGWFYCLFLGCFGLCNRIFIGGLPFPADLRTLAGCLPVLAGFCLLWDILLHLSVYLAGRLAAAPRGLRAARRRTPAGLSGRLAALVERAPFRTFWGLLLLCHLPHLLIKYPAAFCYDAGWQVEQGLGITQLTTHHPVLHTLFMTGCIRLGQAVGSASAGIFLFVLLQMLVCTAIYARVLSLLLSMRPPAVLIRLSFVFFAFFPFVTAYTGQVVKDVLYTAFFLLFMAQLLLYVRDPLAFFRPGDMLLFLLSCLTVCLTRNNGSWILVPVLAVLAVMSRRHLKRAAFFLLCALLPLAAGRGLNRVTGAKNGSIAEALSLPMQQTARFVSSGSPVTPQEEKALKAVFPADNPADLYNPYIADPVKAAFKQDAGTEELMEYLKAWAAMGTRHPLCYLQATLHQNFFLFDPEYTDYDYSAHVTSGNYPWKKMPFSSPSFLVPLQDAYEQCFHVLHRLPVTGVLFGNFTWMCLWILVCGVMSAKKTRGRLLLLLPLVLTVLTIAAGPCICYHPRYTLPVIYSLPLLSGWLLCASSSSVRPAK